MGVLHNRVNCPELTGVSPQPPIKRLKGYRRIFSRYDKLDVLYIGFITFVLIIEADVMSTRPDPHPDRDTR